MLKLDSLDLAEIAIEAFQGHKNTGLLPNAVQRRWLTEEHPTADFLDIINRLYAGDERLFLFNAHAEIRAGLLKSLLIEGEVAPEEEDLLCLRDICVIQPWNRSLSLERFSSRDAKEMAGEWLRLADRLPSEDVYDHPNIGQGIIVPRSAPRCVAILTVSFLPDGREAAHFHHNPSIRLGAACAAMKKIIAMTMPKIRA